MPYFQSILANMHNFSIIFKDTNIRNSLTQFTENHLDRVETCLFDKNGKPALQFLVTAKDKIATPEKIVRQLWLLKFTETYGYLRAFQPES